MAAPFIHWNDEYYFIFEINVEVFVFNLLLQGENPFEINDQAQEQQTEEEDKADEPAEGEEEEEEEEEETEEQTDFTLDHTEDN